VTETEITKLLHIKASDRVLDVGGSMKQLTEINVDTLVDIIHPDDSNYNKHRLTAKHFLKLDIESQDLPFADKSFDICICTHTLEDLHWPFRIIGEISRVAKRGIIITPGRGMDCSFNSVNLTDWQTGSRRIPGTSHHHWLFENIHGRLIITPKNYPLLYSSGMNIVSWTGESECVYLWKDKINFFSDNELNLNFKKLITNYRKFNLANKRHIKLFPVVIFLDNPFFYLKEFTKLLLMKFNIIH
jgi:ubiquinone/menaquinone biosynthesis C-methylase UbiE